MSFFKEIKAINASAKKIHGADIHIMVARAIAFGHDENLVIISGKNHAKAALDFVRVTPGATITEEHHPETDWGDGDVTPAYTNSYIHF